MRNWKEFFQSRSEEELEAIALLRVVECTNGCIQHTFRENHPKALSLGETREAMKYSMAAMKNLKFSVGGIEYSFTGDVAEGLMEARELYVRAFKNGDQSAIEPFFDCSVACVQTLGEDRIRKAGKMVREHLQDHFPNPTVDWGEDYLLRLLKDVKEE